MTHAVTGPPFVLSLAIWLMTAGCAAPTLSMGHQPGPAVVAVPLAEALFVAKAEEGRPLKGKSSIGGSFIGLLPLVPYGSQEITPERGNSRYDFLQDVTDVQVRDLAASGLSRIVAYLPPSLSATTDRPEYVIKLRLEEGIWHRKVTSYGLSLAGVLLWFFLPSAYGSVELALGVDIQTLDGHSLAMKSFRAELPYRQWLFGPPGAFRRKFELCFEEIAPQVRSFVRETLAAYAS